MNKIDLKTAKIDSTIEQLGQTLDLKKEDMICISGKTGLNCMSILENIVKRIPA